jgi:hypothetical protein
VFGFDRVGLNGSESHSTALVNVEKMTIRLGGCRLLIKVDTYYIIPDGSVHTDLRLACDENLIM